MKRWVIFLLMMCIFLSGCSNRGISAQAAEKAITGDLNNDQAITAADALLALQYSVNKITYEDFYIQRADVNADYTINAADALYILQLSIKKIACFGEITNYTFGHVNTLPETSGIPDPFITYRGGRISAIEDWESQRYYLKAALSNYIYGTLPEETGVVSAVYLNQTVLTDCNAIMLEGTLRWGKGLTKNIRITYPQKEGKYPVVIKLDYLCDRIYRSELEDDMLRQERYAFVTISRKDLSPDNAVSGDVPMQNLYPENDLGAVAMWGYGAIACLDFIWDMDFVDNQKICVTGHSRDGKAAIFAAAMDERFSVVVPNGSGCGGAGSFFAKNSGCETLDIMASAFPHWFTSDFYTFKNNAQRLPLDMNFALALIAPRAILRTEAKNDTWANPYGTYAGLLATNEVYKYLGASANYNAMIIRNGDHNQTTEDWRALFEFCDMVFYDKTPAMDFYKPYYPDASKTFNWSAPLAK